MPPGVIRDCHALTGLRVHHDELAHGFDATAPPRRQCADRFAGERRLDLAGDVGNLAPTVGCDSRWRLP